MKKFFLVAKFLLAGATATLAQSVGINNNGAQPDASAILDVSSTSKGLLLPRMTSAQRTAIVSPAAGLQVYQTDGAAGFYYYNGNSWLPLAAPANGAANYTPGAGIDINNTVVSAKNTTALWNANQLQGKDISATAPVNGDVLQYDLATTKWKPTTLAAGSAGWSLTGNAGTNPATNFIGTTDYKNLNFRTTNFNRMTIDSNGLVGVNTTTPAAMFDIQNNQKYYNNYVTTLNATTNVDAIGAMFYSSHQTATSPAFYAQASGNNSTAKFYNTNASNSQPTIQAEADGLNSVLYLKQTNFLGAAKPTLFATNSGAGGAGFFETFNSHSSAILNATYTGGPMTSSVTAVYGSSNDGAGLGTGGYFFGGGLGLYASGNIGAIINGKREGLEINVSQNPQSVNYYGVNCQMNTTSTGSVTGISSFIQAGNTPTVIGIYSNPIGTGAFVTAVEGIGNMNITGSYFSSSDKKLKQNIQPMGSVINKIMQLKPATYQYKTAEYKLNLPKGNQNGLVAQELQQIFPELVAEQVVPEQKDDKTGKILSEEMRYLGVNYTGLIPIVISGMQEQEQKIKALETENAQLRNDIAAIKAKLGL